MATKVNIVEITTKDEQLYSIGLDGPDLVDNARINRIIYEKHGYNKGRQGDFPAYVIFYEGTNIRTVVPQNRVDTVHVEVVETEEVAPELPE